MKICLGNLKWSEDQFWGSTFRGIFLAIEANEIANGFKMTALDYLIRKHCFVVIRTLGSDKEKASEIWPSRWDEEEAEDEETSEEKLKSDIEALKEAFSSY